MGDFWRASHLTAANYNFSLAQLRGFQVITRQR